MKKMKKQAAPPASKLKKKKVSAPIPRGQEDLLQLAQENVQELENDYSVNSKTDEVLETNDELSFIPSDLDLLSENSILSVESQASDLYTEAKPKLQLIGKGGPKRKTVGPQRPVGPQKSVGPLKFKSEPLNFKETDLTKDLSDPYQAKKKPVERLQLQQQQQQLVKLEPEPFYILARNYMNTTDVSKLTLEIKERTILDCSGVQTITDATFYAIARSGNQLELDLIESVILAGCHLVTDQGIAIMSSSLPNVKSIDITGCPKVTERALGLFVSNNKHLTSLKIAGSGVRVVPSKLIKCLKDTVHGCPLVSPNEVLLQTKLDGSYKKDIPMKRVDTMKVVIVRQGGANTNLLRSLRKESQNGEALTYDSSYKIGSTSFPIVECHMNYLDMFLSKRAVYVITTELKDEKKSELEAANILSILCQILTKVGRAAKFILVGIDSDKSRSVAANSLLLKINEVKKATIKELGQALETPTKLIIDTKEEYEMMTRQGRSGHLKHCLEHRDFTILSIQVTSREAGLSDADKNEINKRLMSKSEELDGVCEEYQNFVDSPDMKELLSAKMADILKDGLHDMTSAGSLLKNMSLLKSSPHLVSASLGILNVLGKVCTIDIDSGMYVASIEWICKAVNAVTRDSGVKNSGKLACISDETPIWSEETFEKTVTEKLYLKHDPRSGLPSSLKDLNLVYGSRGVISPALLDEEPPVPLTNFYGKSHEAHCLKAVCEYTLSHNVPEGSFFHVLMTVLKLHTPMMLWRKGVILHDGIVEVMLQREKNSIRLSALCVKGKKEAASLSMLWFTFLQYSQVISYVLNQENLPYKTTVTSDKPSPYKGSIQLHGHNFVAGTTTKNLCSHCGSEASAVDIFKTAQESGNMDIMLSDSSVKLTNGKIEGTAISLDQGGIAVFTVPLRLVDNPTMTFTSLTPVNAPLEVILAVDKTQQLTYDFHTGDVKTVINGKAAQTRKIEAVKLSAVPVTFTLVPHKDGMAVIVRIGMKNQGEFPMPLASLTAKIVSLNTNCMITQAGMKMGLSNEVHPGMRLEALDRLNPSLVAVATVEKISDDGKWLIHFDGWTSKYDYWTEPESVDLHPLGYMEHIGHTKKKYNPRLQEPKNYGRNFEWTKYLEQINADPIPWGVFSDAQTEGTPPDMTYKTVPSSSKEGGPRYLRCRGMVFRGAMIDHEVRTVLRDMPHDVSQDLSEFLTRNQRLFIVLPKSLDKNMIRYPSMAAIANHAEQKVHFLCHSDKFDVHMLNLPGEKFPKLAEYSEVQSVLFLTYLVLLVQEHMIPTNPFMLCKGLDQVPQDQEIIEMGFTRLMRIYVKMLWFMREKQEPQKSQKLQRRVTSHLTLESSQALAVNSLLSSARSTESFNSVVSSQGNLEHVTCKPHELAIAPMSEISQIDMDAFKDNYQLIVRLDLKQNKITELPENLFAQFPNLSVLNLSRNEIMTLPPMDACQNLTSIDISYNKLAALPKGFDKVKESLTYLNISHNPLWTLPSGVQECQGLVELHADNIGKITDMSVLCSKMPNLEILCLNYNIIEKLPSALPPNLKVLGLAGIPIIEPVTSSKTTFTFTSFETFLNENTVLSKLTEEERKKLFELGDVEKTGTLSRDGVTIVNENMMKNEAYKRFGARKDVTGHESLPPFLLTCLKLENLDMSNHCIKRVDDNIATLTSLESLNLSNSLYFLTLSAEITSVPIKELHLKNCPLLKTPPKEIVARGFKAIYGYLRRLRLGSVDCKRTKLMFVGLGGAGKTSLVRVLTESGFSYYHDYGEQITDGIDITRWNVPVAGSAEPITYSTWDFAGQTVYYNTHQFFLSNRAVYLLLWNIRLGYEHAGLDFWLSSIACHAPKAPILVVGTHCDKVEKPRMPTDELKRRYPQISGFYAVSSYSGDGIENMKKDLIRITLEQKYMGEKIPEAWLNLEKVLEKERSKDLMPWKDVQKAGDSCGIIDDVELTQSIQFLHDLGSVQFFNTPFLRTYVVVRPQWIVDVMACVVTVHEGPIKNGHLKHGDMKSVWGDYPADLHPWLLRLTEEFDLTCPLKDQDANIVPCLLPSTEPEYDWPALKSGVRETKMVYKFDYLPAGLFNRAQVRLHQLTDGSVMWKKGSLLKKNKHTAILLQTSAVDVLVKVQGYKPENIMFLVHEVFECLIAESYSGVQYDFYIPCLDCQSEHILEPCMFPASKVHRALEMKAPFLQCDKSFHIMSIPELQAIMPPDRNSDFDDHLGRTVLELKNLGNTDINIFFCYSNKNVPSLADENKLVHPGRIIEDLRKSGHKVSFCDTPETTDMETLTLSMKSAQVVVIGMSDEFIDTEQCRNLIVYCQETLKKPMLLAILGEKTKWQKSNLNIVLADHVYVKIYEASRYNTKIKELNDAIKVKAGLLKKVQDFPKCFVSYSWSNSQQAVSTGTKSKDGSLGWGDPRKVKEFLESKGIKCWLDIERMGQEGFFEDIADGLRKCKVMIACVSDQYVESRNCLMEFRFAISTLKIPVILAVVGTGYKWERSEIGLIAVGHECTKVNLQYENETGMLELLDHVKSVLPKSDVDDTNNTKTTDDQRQSSFQEVLELAERKFLRHLTVYADSLEGDGYPRVVLVDINEKPQLTDEEKRALEGDAIGDGSGYEKAIAENKDKDEKAQEEAINKIYKEKEKNMQEVRKQAEAKLAASRFCFRLLCENEQGWHPVPSSVPFPQLDVPEEDYLKTFAPYLARIHTILKHTGLNMALLNTPDGERLRANLEEWCAKAASDFQDEYKTLLQAVIEQDKDSTKCGLTRCHMPNGKTLWLCSEHEQLAYSTTARKYKAQLDKKSKMDEDEDEKETVANENEPVKGKKSDKLFSDDDEDEDDDDEDDDEFDDESRPATAEAPKRDRIPVKKSLKRQTSQACNVM